MRQTITNILIPKIQIRRLTTQTSLKTSLSYLRDGLEKSRIQCGIPGMSVAILHKGELVLAEGFGKRNDKDPFTAETLMPIGSLTKSFTATTIGELVAEGKLDWDKTPVNKYVPEFELKDPVLTSQLTLVDLLSHRTGLPREIEFSWFLSTETRSDLIKRLKHVEVPSKLTSKYLYSNAMYAVAGEAAANVSGATYEEIVRKKVIEPLSLVNSGFSPVEMKKRSSNHSMPYSAASLQDAQNGLFKLEDLTDICKSMAPAGDMFSNVLDMVRWGKVIMNAGEIDGKQVLSKENVQETLNPHTIIPRPRRTPEFAPALTYGLGWDLDSYKGHTFYSHDGGVSGFRSRLEIFPDADLVIAQLMNVTNSELFAQGFSRHITDEILNLPKTQDWIINSIKETKGRYDLMESMTKSNLPERIQSKPASQELQAYVGEYTNLIHGDVSITVGKDETTGEETLFYKIGCLDGKLSHYHFDSFVYEARYLEISSSDIITFRGAKDGRVESLELMADEYKRK